MIGRSTLFALVALSLTGLAACSSKEDKIPEVQERTDGGFQINKLFKSLETAPDEFAVLTNKPLVVPENVTTVTELPRPTPGVASALEPDPINDARSALLAPSADRAVAATYSGPPSASEAALIAAAGPIDPQIRATVAAEQGQYEAEQSLYLLDRIIPAARSLRGEDARNVINPEFERRRLRGEIDENGVEIVSAPAPLPSQSVPQYDPVSPATVENGIVIQPSQDGGSELIYLPE